MLDNIPNFQGLNVTFNTGEDCNLACKYCYEVDKRKSVLSLDYAKKFVDILLDDPDPIGVMGTDNEWMLNSGLILDFIGGDALMHPELVDSILRYFVQKAVIKKHRWAFNWRGSISTNGTLFENPEVRKFIERWHRNLSIGVSVDGSPALHDSNRIYPDGRGSMAKIREWWDWYRNFYPDGSTKSTLSEASIPYIYESLVFMREEMDIKYVNQNFIFENMELDQADLDLLDEQMALGVAYVKAHPDMYWGMIDKRFADAVPYPENVAANPCKSWCGSGSMPALSPDGKIYPCFRFLPHTQAQHVDMSGGDSWTGFERKDNFVCIRGKTREVISPKKCRECDIESGCAWCIAGSYSETGGATRQTYICEVQKIQTKWAKIYWGGV